MPNFFASNLWPPNSPDLNDETNDQWRGICFLTPLISTLMTAGPTHLENVLELVESGVKPKFFYPISKDLS